jgi:DNA-3-methyladenine glycosylase II
VSIAKVRPAAAIKHLREVDPVFAGIIEQVGPCRFKARADGSHFDSLVRAIVYQQITGKAAETILGRVHAHFGGPPTPAALAAATEEQLRAAGLSRQKQRYLRDLAGRAHSGEVALDHLHELPDADVVEALTSIMGIGRWTAEIFLLFRLGRADVLPTSDLGIQKAVQKAYRTRGLPPPARVARIGARWAPHRSVASWYLWRYLDGPAAM